MPFLDNLCRNSCIFQGKKLFFHFTRPSDKYFPDFGCPNIKPTRPKNDAKCFISKLTTKTIISIVTRTKNFVTLFTSSIKVLDKYCDY